MQWWNGNWTEAREDRCHENVSNDNDDGLIPGPQYNCDSVYYTTGTSADHEGRDCVSFLWILLARIVIWSQSKPFMENLTRSSRSTYRRHHAFRCGRHLHDDDDEEAKTEAFKSATMLVTRSMRKCPTWVTAVIVARPWRHTSSCRAWHAALGWISVVHTSATNKTSYMLTEVESAQVPVRALPENVRVVEWRLNKLLYF